MVSVRRFLLIALTLLLLPALVATARADGRRSSVAPTGFLTGQLLVATPDMGDPRFAKTVIYMISHDADGAMGLVVNRAFGDGPLGVLLQSLGVETGEADTTIRLHYGGPVEPGSGFVLHSSDYAGPTTKTVAGGVAVTVGTDVLEAIATGAGPERRAVILGYAGWGPGQLEDELARDDWLTAPADNALIFADDLDTVWRHAMETAGLSL